MSDPARTVHIVDDDEAIRQSVGFLLRKAGYSVKSYVSGLKFLASVTRETSGCALLDVRMPEIDGMEVQARLSRQGIALPVIMLTGHGDVTLAVRAVKAGAIEFLEKPFERTALLAAIDEALGLAGRTDRSRIAAAEATVRLAALTPRERDVLDGMVLGRPNKLIAFELGIATRTVEVHRANLMDKLSARSLSDVLRIAFAAGLGDDGAER
ncbi:MULTISPECIES: response regulator transcription factor [unclassified Sphingomonas]|uniref:response regulator transcription factor n=1 Tax=unclassified Sphingomonas TaxID=196159 RepID=UPI0006FE40F8|nr:MULTISPECIES: response regulator [unclassified Sphingomonas]KQM27936.1 two-component system response regulator [Sphingomonas sp. Leaf9]KQM44275.1 two-component system response regulator [Sphingomonas sp. Leaf11]KQM81077.1 two-component system response regulator [Sphingomonas sp. Leaf23]